VPKVYNLTEEDKKIIMDFSAVKKRHTKADDYKSKMERLAKERERRVGPIPEEAAPLA